MVHPLVRETAFSIISECESRADECELEAIFNAVKHGDARVRPLRRGFKYIADPRSVDYFTAPHRSLSACLRGACGGDCLPGETLLLTGGYKFKPIAEIQVGDTVMGDGRWTRVTQVWDKGVQEILEFELNNGSVLRCTPDHRVFVVPKHRGSAGPRDGAEEIRAGDLRPGDDLLTVQSIPYGNESLGADRAQLLGLHVADGWIDYSRSDGRPLRVGISGLDGWRKEENKKLVESMCARLGVETRWHEKYIAINDEALAQWLAGCGRLAPNKLIPSLDLDASSVREIMSGLAADADVRDGVFSTTSPVLALQYRLMLRMQGRSAHIRRVDLHGGLGKHPIYRVTPRRADDPRRPHARIRSISEGRASQTYDIEVDGHRFYLPETDLVVHNCDDHTALICALAGTIGFKVGLRAWGEYGEDFSHVYAVAMLSKRNPTRVVGMDTTVEESTVGWEPPQGRVMTAWLS